MNIKLIILLIVLISITNICNGQSRCNKPKDEGIFCSLIGDHKTITRWWYVSSEKVCKSFEYKGCGGNSNKFISKASCEKACKK